MKCRLISTILVFAFCFLLLPTMAFATENTLPSGIRDAEAVQKIDAYIEAHKETTAAVSVAVFRGEDTIYQTAYGYAHIGNHLAADEKTVFEWGSVSKLLVWVSVMQLWEQGRISLDADVREYLPDGFLTRLKYQAPITMQNLMNHNAGWQDAIFQLCATDAGSVLPLGDALKATEPAQIYEPGTICAYSNWGAALAGYIVERISGQPFSEYVQDHIFKPLGMKHSALSPTFSDNPWVLSKLQEAEGYTTELEPIGDGLFYLNLYPAGSAAGTLDDFLAFAKALIPAGKGASTLFRKSETLTTMLSPTLVYPGTDIGYVAHGFWSHEFSVTALGHGGNTNMYSSYLLIDPGTGVGMVIMTNQSGEIRYNYGLPEIVFGETGQMASGNAATDLSHMAGLYYSARTIRKGIGKMYTLLNLRPLLSQGNGNLKASLFGLAELDLRPAGPNTLMLTQRLGTVEQKMLARYFEESGRKKISSLYGDMIEADAGIWALAIAFLLFGIAVLWSTAVLMISLIRFILRKIRKRERRKGFFHKYHIILCAAALVLMVNILLVGGIMIPGEGSAGALVPHIAASIVLGILPVAYAVLLAAKWRKLACGKMQKAVYLITLCIGFVMTLNVLVLELYRL